MKSCKTYSMGNKEVDLVLVSELYRSKLDNRWIADRTRKGLEKGSYGHAMQLLFKIWTFVKAKVKPIHSYSVYVPLSWTQQEF